MLQEHLGYMPLCSGLPKFNIIMPNKLRLVLTMTLNHVCMRHHQHGRII